MAMSVPMGPPPNTSTASPGFTSARRTSCTAMASGSMSAACSSDSEAGTRMSRFSRTAQYCCMPPALSTPSTLRP